MHSSGFNFEYIPSHRDSKQGETNPNTRFVLHGGVEATGTQSETVPTQIMWYYTQVPSYCFGSATSRYKINTGHIWVVQKVPKLIQKQNIHEQQQKNESFGNGWSRKCFPPLDKSSKEGSQAALFPTPEISERKENIKTQQPFRVSTPEMISNHPPQHSHPVLQKNHANHQDKIQTLRTPFFGASEKEEITQRVWSGETKNSPLCFFQATFLTCALYELHISFLQTEIQHFLSGTHNELLNGTQ